MSIHIVEDTSGGDNGVDDLNRSSKPDDVNVEKVDSAFPMLDDNQNDLQPLLSPLVKKEYGEFEIELTKVNGSLGFTLSKVQ